MTPRRSPNASSQGQSLDPAALREKLTEELENNPYRTIGIAAGVGFALGIGLWGPVVGLLSSRVGRFMANALLDPVFRAVGEHTAAALPPASP